MGNKNGKSKNTANGENESEADKQTELNGSADMEKGTDVDEIYRRDDIVHNLKANTDLDDVQCDSNVPDEQNDSKSEHKKETENIECANEINAEKKQNVDFAGMEIKDSTSEGLKMEENETPIASTQVAENSQSSLKMEALNEQETVTQIEISVIDKIDNNESDLSKPNVDTEDGVNDLKGNTDLGDVQCDKNVPVEKIDSKSEKKKEIENNEFADETSFEHEKNAICAGIKMNDSTSEGLKMEETEMPLVSTYMAENNQSPLKMEALNEQETVTQIEVSVIDKIDNNESDLSKPNVDTEDGVNDLKGNTDLGDVQCDKNVPVEKIDSKSENKKEIENNEFADETSFEYEKNAICAGIKMNDSTSEGLKMEETEMPLVSTYMAENNQSPLKMEALNEQETVTENEINVTDKVYTESNLSKPSVDTDTSVNDLKSNTDLDDVHCDQNVPVEKNDFKSENKKETENNEFANETNDEKEHNANFTRIEIKVSKSEELRMKEIEKPLVSTCVAENNQSPLQMEALNKQETVTDNETNVIDNIDTESNLSKPSGGTEVDVNDICATIETNDIKTNYFENDANDSVEDVSKEAENSIQIFSEQDHLSKELDLRKKEDIKREMDDKISKVKSIDETIAYEIKHEDKSCDEIMIDNITESQKEIEDKNVINIIETEPANTIISMKDDHSNEKNSVDSTFKIDSTGEQKATEKEQKIATSSDQEVVKTQSEQENWEDEQNETSSVQLVNETVSQDCVSKESEKCLETHNENGEDNRSENLKKVTSEFFWKDGGTDVQITGSFNSWENKMNMNKRDDVFVISIDLLPGECIYKYCVDGEWKVDENKPIRIDEDGQVNNVVVVAERMQ